MNCQTTEPLIPLFIEADLDATEMQQVTAHVEACAACHALTTEFRASQSSLHALAVPEFDEATMHAMRAAVQYEIARPTMADWLASRWHWKLAWAAAACLLLGAFVWQRQFLTPENKPVVAQGQPPDTPAPAKDSAAPGTVRRGGASYRPTRKPSPQPGQRAATRGTVPAPSEAEPVTAAPAATLALTASPETPTPAAEPEMLRMEFQTADPNIRIIWLTPKEPARTNPAADTK
jgi:Putative zinc-finger